MHVLHVTLTTGHRRLSHREEISAAALAACSEILDAIARPGVDSPSVAVPGQPGYRVAGSVSGRCCVLTVHHDDTREPVCTIGIAAHSRCGAGLWRELHRWGSLPVATDPERCPPEPWVAAALAAGIAAHPEAARWLGDFERCLAWAWVARTEESGK